MRCCQPGNQLADTPNAYNLRLCIPGLKSGVSHRKSPRLMPIYAYKCESCGHAKDVLQKMSDAPLTDCPSCGASAFKKQLTAAGFQLKGSGWYVTDFRGGPTAGAPAGEGGESGGGKSADAPAAAGSASSPTAASTSTAAAPAASSSPVSAPAPAPATAKSSTPPTKGST